MTSAASPTSEVLTCVDGCAHGRPWAHAGPCLVHTRGRLRVCCGSTPTTLHAGWCPERGNQPARATPPTPLVARRAVDATFENETLPYTAHTQELP